MASIFGAFEGDELDVQAFGQRLDEAVNLKRSALLNADLAGDPVAPQQVREPGLAGALGAALTNIVQPGAAQQFANRAGAIQQANAQMQMRADEINAAAQREQLAQRFGVDLTEFRNLMGLRSALLQERMLAETGQDPITARMSANEIIDAVEAGADINQILADPGQMNALRYVYKTNDPSVIQTQLEAIQGRSEATFQDRRTRTKLAEQRFDLSANKEARLQNESQLEAAQNFVSSSNELAELEASIREAESKLEPNFIERAIFGTPDQVDEDDERMDKEIRLKTMVDGKERFTLRELREKYRNLVALNSYRLELRPGLLNIIDGMSPAPQDQGNGGGDRLSDEDIIRALREGQ